MSAWRREALAALPEFHSTITQSDGPMALWIELGPWFEKAVSNADGSLVTRILKFAAWCISDRSGPLPNDTSTAVVCAFYEHLPTQKRFWPHMRSWFSLQEFNELMPTFEYHLSVEELAELKRVYQQKTR